MQHPPSPPLPASLSCFLNTDLTKIQPAGKWSDLSHCGCDILHYNMAPVVRTPQKSGYYRPLMGRSISPQVTPCMVTVSPGGMAGHKSFVMTKCWDLYQQSLQKGWDQSFIFKGTQFFFNLSTLIYAFLFLLLCLAVSTQHIRAGYK